MFVLVLSGRRQHGPSSKTLRTANIAAQKLRANGGRWLASPRSRRSARSPSQRRSRPGTGRFFFRRDHRGPRRRTRDRSWSAADRQHEGLGGCPGVGPQLRNRRRSVGGEGRDRRFFLRVERLSRDRHIVREFDVGLSRTSEKRAFSEGSPNCVEAALLIICRESAKIHSSR